MHITTGILSSSCWKLKNPTEINLIQPERSREQPAFQRFKFDILESLKPLVTHVPLQGIGIATCVVHREIIEHGLFPLSFEVTIKNNTLTSLAG